MSLILLIPDRLDWITGRWAKELSNSLYPHPCMVLPSWYLRRHPFVFKLVLRKCSAVVNIDPWFAEESLSFCRLLKKRTYTSSVLHHVNQDDQNAKFIVQFDLPVGACVQSKQHLESISPMTKKVLLVENGVDLSEFCPQSQAGSREIFEVSNEKFVIGFSLKMSSDASGRKGLDVFERLMEKMSRNGNVLFLVSGGGKCGFEKRFASYKSSFKHLGYIDQSKLPNFYSALDVFLCTSRIEAGPATVLEALACSTPVISSNTGIVQNVVRDYENGFCIEDFSADSFEQRINQVIGSKELSSFLRRQARKSVSSDWSWQSKMEPYAKELMKNVEGSISMHTGFIALWMAKHLELDAERVEKSVPF